MVAEFGNKRGARVAVASSQLDRATIEAAVMQANLRLRVTQAYNEAAAAERRLVNAREQVVIASEILRGAKVRVFAGRASPLEEQRADVARINAQGAAERAERSSSVAIGNLVRLIGRGAGALDASWFVRVDMAGPRRPVDSQDTLAGAAAQADLTTATAQVRLARSQRVPTVTVGAAARRLEASNDMAGVFSLSVPFPLFNNGRAAVDLASAQRQQADAQRHLALLDVEQAIASATAEAANAATTARAATGPTLAAAQEAARIARIGYREGKFGQLDLLDSTRLVQVIATLDNSGGTWRVGEPVTAAIMLPSTGDRSIAVPSTAVQSVENKTVVFVRTPTGFRAVPIATGRRNGDQVTITSGLVGTERVATTIPSRSRPNSARAARWRCDVM